MITLDTNLTLNSEMYYYLPLLKSKNSNAYSSIDANINAQAAKGTSETQKTGETQKATVPTDYSTLIETLKLTLPENKLAILKLIPHAELMQFLTLLNKEQMVNGLSLFTKSKLLQFVYNVPKDQLLKILGKLFISMDQVVDLISIKDLNKFLSSKKINKNDILKIFQSLSTTELAQIAEASTGIPQGNKSQSQLMQLVNSLNSDQLTEGIKGLEYKKMRGIVSQLLVQDPTLFSEFSQEALFQQTTNFAKPSLIEGMGVLDTDLLMKCLDKLPDSLLSLVITQIDTDTFAQILVNDYQKLLGSIAG